MKSLQTKVILSAIVLMFALVATIGSTYAWFTVSNTVTVSEIQMNVQSSESLLIRAYNGEDGDEAFLLDATSYVANLTLADILTPSTSAAMIAGGYVDNNTYDNLSAWRLSPVTATSALNGTTIDGYNLSIMNIDTKAYTAIDPSLPSADVNSATGKVIDISFWLLSQGTTGLPIVLEDLTISASNVLGAQDAVVNAVKLAVWKAANADTPVTPAAVTFGLDNDYDFAFTLGMRGYDSVTAANNSILTASKTSLLAAQEEYYKTGETADTADVFSYTLAGADAITTLTKNVPTLVTVRIYIEGWDAQCTNSVLAAIFTLNFKFTLQQ
ncbi:MAG: hypothetical protein PHC32_02780 [Candidatus Izemoplasmatales bacterium]|nr:hypothetical protein [Candidatus Izemoplasmatales bacterium]